MLVRLERVGFDATSPAFPLDRHSLRRCLLVPGVGEGEILRHATDGVV
jgi:hypothetical protein